MPLPAPTPVASQPITLFHPLKSMTACKKETISVDSYQIVLIHVLLAAAMPSSLAQATYALTSSLIALWLIQLPILLKVEPALPTKSVRKQKQEELLNSHMESKSAL